MFFACGKHMNFVGLDNGCYELNFVLNCLTVILFGNKLFEDVIS